MSCGYFFFGRDAQLFCAVREKGVLFCGERGKFSDKLRAAVNNLGRVAAELHVPDGQRFKDEREIAVFEQGVALFENFVVAHEGDVIAAGELGDGDV